MSLSRICKIFCLFLAIQCVGFTLKADLASLATHSCTTTADCPKDSWATCCSGKCIVVDGCCPGETPCGGSLCCSVTQKCDAGLGKCIPDNACYPGYVMCQGKFSPVGKCCSKDLCSPSGQCCLETQETLCGEKCCTHGHCTTKGVCCKKGQEACQDSCCTADKPYCIDGKCTPLCDTNNPCSPQQICVETRCCPKASLPNLCGGKCCSSASICLEGQCTPCPQGSKACNCPPGKKKCTPSCIPEFETCKHGVPTCPSGNVICGNECMNPLDRICVNGKITTCPENNVVVNNMCTACPANNIIRNFKCQPCPSGEVSVGNNCHTCITHLECRYSAPWNWWMETQNVCFSGMYATFKDGTTKNITGGGGWSQQCCSDLASTVENLTNFFFCPGVSPGYVQVPPYAPYQHGCYSPECAPTPSSACEKKCFDACKHNLSFIQVAACFWLCAAACEL